MSDPKDLREIGWRRRLTAEEEASIGASPEARADLSDESRLTEGLKALSDVPISSNFTARVLAAVDREAGQRDRSRSRWSWKAWVPRVAWGVSGVLTVLALTSLVSHQQEVQAREFARSLTAVSGVLSLPSPEVLQDFEAVRHLNPNPAPDEELLAAFAASK